MLYKPIASIINTYLQYARVRTRYYWRSAVSCGRRNEAAIEPETRPPKQEVKDGNKASTRAPCTVNCGAQYFVNQKVHNGTGLRKVQADQMKGIVIAWEGMEDQELQRKERRKGVGQ